ncbi:hypothetical protein Pyn_06613 [Prunus yedoensis var. nudiflora]|uniref:Uncharacterized protein n=1 Tax=Prunus yedoensis var. nudiflora TaxID=2094558 RepID=A0A314YAS1_PRUYE|nr:hypothetical protein Pyn_06613 [Prunus yedoensis var. nudiflora]
MAGDKTMTKPKGYSFMHAAGSLQHMAKKQTQGRPPEKPKGISVRRLLGEKISFRPTLLSISFPYQL